MESRWIEDETKDFDLSFCPKIKKLIEIINPKIVRPIIHLAQVGIFQRGLTGDGGGGVVFV